MKKLLLISLFIMAIVLSGCGAKYDPDYSEPSLPEINNATSVVTNQKIYYTVDYRIIDSDIVNSIKNIENVVTAEFDAVSYFACSVLLSAISRVISRISPFSSTNLTGKSKLYIVFVPSMFRNTILYRSLPSSV